MKEDLKKEFWEKYIGLDEIKQRKHLATLIGVQDKGFFETMTMSLFKSYIDDIIEVLKKGVQE